MPSQSAALEPPAYLPNDMDEDGSSDPWIAIEPVAHGATDTNESQSIDPPTFRESRFDIILRRQRTRPPDGGGRKHPEAPSSRFLNLSRDFEFAGWGSFSKLTLTPEDSALGEEKLRAFSNAKHLGQFTATALPGNAVLGSVFYALPAVVGVSGVYSPISMFVATLTPFLWRPIMEELASALPISGAPYSYILNVAGKSLALLGAALLLLDFASTSVVSTATAAAYLSGEVRLPFPEFVAAALLLVAFTLVSLTGLKESARIAFVVLAFHITTMIALAIASCVHWGKSGNSQLWLNWVEGQASSGSAIARQIFDGFCLGMLGLTGIECSPSYIGRIKPGRFPLVLRNLHLPAILLNTLMIMLVLATVPLKTILQGANVLSVLAQISAGRWLRRWIVVDAIIVLSGGILTGILSVCALLEQLANDRIIPQIFLNVLPISGAPHIAILSFTALNALLYASAGAKLSIVSNMFSLVWLTVMALFPLALICLRFNRGRLRRDTQTPLSAIALSLIITPVVFAGNIAIDHSTAGYFATYLVGVLLVFWATQNKVHMFRIVYWTYDQYPLLHRWSISKGWGKALIDVMARLKRQPICILVKTDEINHLLHMILYVKKNEETSCLKIVHFTDEETGVPSELEANAKILDEAFPEITIDLIIVQGAFTPSNVISLAGRLKIPSSLMFMSCPGPNFLYPVAEFGTRVISL